MNTALLPPLIALVVLFALVWFSHGHLPAYKVLEGWFQEALQEFRETVVSAVPRSHSFDGGAAKIVKVEKIGGFTRGGLSRETFTVVIFACSPAGEYFMFRKTSTDRALFKHIEKGVALNVLHLDKQKPVRL